MKMETEENVELGILEGLSDEILLHIIQYLDALEDRIHLSNTSTRFQNLLQDSTLSRQVLLPWNLRLERVSLLRYLGQPGRALLVTSFTANDLYWIPSALIRNIALKLHNLKAFHVAGTSLSWKHFSQILQSCTTLFTEVSWTWDNELQSTLRTTGGTEKANAAWEELYKVQHKLRALKILVFHIPPVFKLNKLVMISYAGLSYVVSLCTSLEQLWILSWPRNHVEHKYGNALSLTEDFHPDMNLGSLKTFVLSVMEPPRIFVPRLVLSIVDSFKRQDIGVTKQPHQLYLDHPLLHINFKDTRIQRASPWPAMDLSRVESLAFPLMEGVLAVLRTCNLGSCKHISMSHGTSQFISLNELFDSAVHLESFSSKAFNYRLNWQRFTANHPNLKAINVSEDMGVPYPDFCVGLATIPNLNKLSIPTFALLEIRNPEIISSFRAQSGSCHPGNSSTDSTVEENFASHSSGELFTKRRRVGPSSSSRSGDRSICGLDLLTNACPLIYEFEIGFTKVESRGGKMMPESLGTISRWKNLSKLTLDKIPITNGVFLIEIAKSCKLTTLRLTDLGPRGHCVYRKELCTALRLCSELRDFRLEQNYIGAPSYVLEALESCKKLERLVFFSLINDRALDPPGVLKLMESCFLLTVLYLIVQTTPKTLCHALKMRLEADFKPARPALSLMIRNTMNDEETFTFPSIHYRQMVVFAPQVSVYTGFPTF